MHLGYCASVPTIPACSPAPHIREMGGPGTSLLACVRRRCELTALPPGDLAQATLVWLWTFSLASAPVLHSMPATCASSLSPLQGQLGDAGDCHRVCFQALRAVPLPRAQPQPTAALGPLLQPRPQPGG